jgi:ADP-ribose pyrophosphatase YjhB (NUDIX family)
LLLVRRAAEPRAGCWDSPGGFCKPDEHPAETAVREAYEETGIRIVILGYLGLWSSPYPPAWPGGPDRFTHAAYYHAAPIDSAKARPGPEVAEIGWFDADAVPEEIA